MGQASLLRRGHCRPQAHDSVSGQGIHPSSYPLIPRKGRLEHIVESQGDEVLTQWASSTCKHPLKRRRGSSQQGHGL